MYNVIQCAVQGRGHIKDNIPCQDKTYSLCKNGTHVIALADGAGSAKFSHFGAAYVTKKICENLVDEFNLYFEEKDGVAVKRKILNFLLNGLETMAFENSATLKDFASTLLVVAISLDRYIIIHIGDGVIGYLKDNELKVATQPDNGEFVNTTFFVTSKDVVKKMRLMKGYLNSIKGFILMSDGTEVSFYNKKEKTLTSSLIPIMNLMNYVNSEDLQNELLCSFETIIKKNTVDDCSISILMKDYFDFLGFDTLSVREKYNLLFNTDSYVNKKKLKLVKRYSEILFCLSNPKNLKQLSREIRLKEKYLKKHLSRLLEMNYVIKKNNSYKTILIMKKNEGDM